jgi:phage-related protein
MDSHRILSAFPDPVQRHVGFALYQAQMGNKHPDAKPLKHVASGTLEVVSDHRGDTFRTVYTVKLEKRSTFCTRSRRNRSRASRRRRVKSNS